SGSSGPRMNSSSQSRNQCRPLTFMRGPEDPEACAPGTGIGRGFQRIRHAATAGILGPQPASAAGANRLTGRADTGAAPFVKRVLDDAVLARMITDDGEGPAGRERVPEVGQRAIEVLELVVHRDPDRLEDPGEVIG